MWGKDAVFTLKKALAKRKPEEEKTLVIRSDNGPQFVSHLFEESCENLKIDHERIPIKCPNKNAHYGYFMGKNYYN